MLSILKYNKASVVFCIILILLLIINPVKKSANGDGKPDIINLIKKHNLESEARNFVKKSDTIRFVMNHHTALNSLSGTLDALKSSKTSTHYIIDNDGKIYLVVDEGRTACHAGVSFWNDSYQSLNTYSIGIEHINFGMRNNADEMIKINNKDYNFIVKDNPGWKVIKGSEILNYDTFDKNEKIAFPFSDKQVESSIKLNQYLRKKYNIDPFDIINHYDAAIPSGRKTDPSILFPFYK